MMIYIKNADKISEQLKIVLIAKHNRDVYVRP
jgi:3'-phosphoadenosine 5'-phosphosulfate (PAPS) 3'-phosphatase